GITLANGTLSGDYPECSLSCDDGYIHTDDNMSCINSRICVVPNGTGLEMYENGSWGSCVATECDDDYKLDPDTVTCVEKTNKEKFVSRLGSYAQAGNKKVVWVGDSITEQGKPSAGVGDLKGFTTFIEAQFPGITF